MIGLKPTIYQRGAGGIPSTSVQLLTPKLTSIDWTIVDMGGFESATLAFTGTIEDALFWFDQLMASLVISGPDAETCWEGYLTQVDATLGQETHSRSLDGMGNRVRVRYTTRTGVAGVTPTVSDTTSQGIYGVRDYVEGFPGVESTAATNRANALLSEKRWPTKRPSSAIQTGSLGSIEIRLIFAGWYYTLDWVLTSRSSTTSTSTTTQVGALIAASGVGIGVTNAFLNTATTNIVASGISDTEYIDADTPYRDKIETLLQQGNGTNRYSWGVYEDRTFYADAWAGATPTTVAYRRHLNQAKILNSAGAVVLPWQVRPNTMYEIVELLDVNPRSNEPDAAGRYYVARVSFHADRSTIGVRLEPSDSNDLDAQLARYNR